MSSVAPFEPCPSCGSTTITRVGPTHSAVHNDARYTLLGCADCDLRFWSPLVADPTIYAEEGYEAYADYHSGQRPFPRWAEPLFSELPERRAAALDIGCGDGAVLARLRDVGFDPHGIDLDERSIAVAASKYGLTQVQAKTLGDYLIEARASDRRFGLLTFFEVLEHQDNPLRFLADVASLCEPDAVVAGSVPNRKRFLASADRHLGDGDLPPHHFLWFSPKSLKFMLERAGFAAVNVSYAGHLPLRDVIPRLDRVVRRRSGTWVAPLRAVATGIGKLAALPVWAGFHVRPTHLFFTCRWPSGNRVASRGPD